MKNQNKIKLFEDKKVRALEIRMKNNVIFQSMKIELK